MKKIILAVILMTATGGITYYLLQKKKQTQIVTVNKEFVFGKWKIDSLLPQNDSTKDGLVLLLFAIDSTMSNLTYDIRTDGKVIISHPSDSLKIKDTASFSWGKRNEFLWKEKLTDSNADTLQVLELDKEKLILISPDSTLIYLKKT
jgi:hypothetical protein